LFSWGGPCRDWDLGGIEAVDYRFLLVKMDASPVMAIIAGAIEAIGAEKKMLRPTPTIERIEMTSAKICPPAAVFYRSAD
jgi:hypothetical protein